MFFSENKDSDWFECPRQPFPNRFKLPTYNNEEPDLTKVPTEDVVHNIVKRFEPKGLYDEEREEWHKKIIEEYEENK
jgi:hypothetical protein